MSDEANHPSQTPEPERGGHAGASNGPTPQAGTRTMMLIGIGIVCFFLLLLAIGVIPRLRNDQALTMAAQRAQNNVPQVYVIRPEPASEADLTLAATTQAIQDSIIYARTSGYLRKIYVDIGDRVTAGQLFAEIVSPVVDHLMHPSQIPLHGAYQLHCRSDRTLRDCPNRRPPRVRQYSSGLFAEREGRPPRPSYGPPSTHGTCNGKGNAHGWCHRSRHADPADPSRYSKPDAPVPSRHVRLCRVQDRGGRYALASPGHCRYLRRAGHAGGNCGTGKQTPLSKGDARPRLRHLNRHPGRTKRERTDRETA